MLDKKRKAQVSIEYFIIFGTLLIFLMFIVYYFMTTIPPDIQMKQAVSAVNKMSKAADAVYSLSPGSKRIVYVFFPSAVSSVSFVPFPSSTGSEIVLNISHEGRVVDIFAMTKGNVTGEIPFGAGQKKNLHKLFIEKRENNLVTIISSSCVPRSCEEEGYECNYITETKCYTSINCGSCTQLNNHCENNICILSNQSP